MMNFTVTKVCSEDTPVFCLARTVSISVVLGVIVVLTVIGNIFVIAAYFRDNRIKSSVANMFILSLSISDLISGAVSIPLNTIWVLLDYWPFGKLFCQVWLMLDYTSTNVAVITIIFISLDRYWLVTKKLAYSRFQTHRRAAVMIAVSWAVYSIFYAIVVFAWSSLTDSENVDYDEECELEPYEDAAFLAFELFAEFLIPLLIIVYLNSVVYIRIKKRSKGMFLKHALDHNKPSEVTTVSATCGDRIRPEDVKLELIPENKTVDAALNATSSSDRGCYNNEGLTMSLEEAPNHPDHGTDMSLAKAAPEKGAVHTQTLKTAESSTSGTKAATTQVLKSKRKEFYRHRKAAITLSVLVNVFVVCWLPFFVASLVSAFCTDCVSDLVWEVVNYLLWCNSTINPFLYALLVVRFRENFRRFLCLSSNERTF